jgi:hypothetical protein
VRRRGEHCHLLGVATATVAGASTAACIGFEVALEVFTVRRFALPRLCLAAEAGHARTPPEAQCERRPCSTSRTSRRCWAA